MADVSHTASSAWKHGILGGLLVGVVFALAEMIGSVFLGAAFLDPLYAFASVPLRTDPAEISLANAFLAGIGFHLAYSVVLGIIAAFLVRSLGMLHSMTSTILFMTFFGFVTWIVDFYVFAPLLGLDWFSAGATSIAQFVYHTFFFGTALGLYMIATWVHTSEAHRIGRFHAHA